MRNIPTTRFLITITSHMCKTVGFLFKQHSLRHARSKINTRERTKKQNVGFDLTRILFNVATKYVDFCLFVFFKSTTYNFCLRNASLKDTIQIIKISHDLVI